MFLAIPLENKPSWRSPPWMTLLLIVLNMAVYWGWQVPEEQAVERVAAIYASSELPAIELPAFAEHLRREAEHQGDARAQRRAKAVKQALNDQRYAELYQLMWDEARFRRALLAQQVIRPGDAAFAAWSAARARMTPLEPAPFTHRWAASYEPDAPRWQPVRWLTSTFLHGSTQHLLGNMVFLFLFGFTLEMTLGAGVYLLMYLLGGLGASALAGLVYAGMGGFGLGASGAIAALMGMYVVLYRLRRIRFFYQFLFYFNYARWPALVMLPVWMGFELLQHFIGARQVAYMAHFGGLLTGALAMWAWMSVRPVQTLQERAEHAQEADAPLRQAIGRAQALTDGLQFDRAARAWQAAARLAPGDPAVLQAWFSAARHEPAGEDFHAAARRIFKLPANDAATRSLQHRSYQTYLQQARPGVRLSADTMHRLVRSFSSLGEFADAERLAKVLDKSAPQHPEWPTTLALLVNALAKAGRMEQARAWLPTLQRVAPQEPVTLWLAGTRG